MHQLEKTLVAMSYTHHFNAMYLLHQNTVLTYPFDKNRGSCSLPTGYRKPVASIDETMNLARMQYNTLSTISWRKG